MTLILNYIAPHVAVCVGDRLITRGSQTHEARFNKTVLCYARDAIVSVSFTGPAYIRDTSTDDWIASQILGINYDPRAGMSFGRGGPGYLRQIRNRVVAGLRRETQLQGALFRHYIEVHIAGIRSRNDLMIPSALVVIKSSNSDEIHFEKLTVGSAVTAPFTLLNSGIWRQEDYKIISKYVYELGIKQEAMREDEYISRKLTQLLREMAEHHSTIGKEAMVIRNYLPESEGVIEMVSDNPNLDNTFSAIMGGHLANTPVAYTPWIISPGLAFSPMQIAGAGSVLELSRSGGSPYSVILKGYPQDPSKVGFSYWVGAPRRGPH